MDCGSPPGILNGTASSPANTTYQDSILYSCDIGHSLSGSPMVTCLASGRWSITPNCTGTNFMTRDTNHWKF